MPYSPQVKQLAHWFDIECWKSYSGKPVEVRRALDVRRMVALRSAQKTIDEAYFECGVLQPERDNMPCYDHYRLFPPPMSEGPLYNADGSWTGNRDHWPDPQPAKRYHAHVMKIEMMLHFATCAGPFAPEAQRISPAYTKFVKQLLADELIERPTHEQREAHPGWAYMATERGRAYVEALKDTQLPIAVETSTTWRIPE